MTFRSWSAPGSCMAALSAGRAAEVSVRTLRDALAGRVPSAGGPSRRSTAPSSSTRSTATVGLRLSHLAFYPHLFFTEVADIGFTRTTLGAEVTEFEENPSRS